MIPELLEIATIHAAYREGTLTPHTLLEELFNRIGAYPDQAVFISLVARETALAQASALNIADLENMPLFGIPYVVKDNMDVVGMHTTAGCPDYAYTAAQNAVVVSRLNAAGAILLGKANLDQFATGLNGTRSPYGAPRCVFNADYVCGGSSSGSAVSVGAALAVFSLGTDTAGSGRVPAAFNNLIGLKPSIGRIPTTGIVPACKTLDCVSIFANSTADALTVLNVAEGFDAGDCYSRPPANTYLPAKPRVGILSAADRDFAGDEDNAALYDAAIQNAVALGWEFTEIDYGSFKEIAAALYGGPYVAERQAATKSFFETKPEAINPVVRGILESANKFSAADAFLEIYRIQALRVLAQNELAKCDILLLPTTPRIYTVADMLADPLVKNARLGIYTNFVNFLDLAAIALPAGFNTAGLPFGVTIIGPAFSELALGAYADALHQNIGAGAGIKRIKPTSHAPRPQPETTIVVAGAHLSGMVLNHELTSRGGQLLAATTTAPGYKLFALATTPPKPGLVRAPGFVGAGIAVELWGLSKENFGSFIAALPAPMGIGKVTLADGTEHPGFLCEAYALNDASDITSYGGWRHYLATK